jgi:cysteine synthase A
MTDEEISISRSTPRYRFDLSPTPAKPATAAPPPTPTAKSAAFVEEVVNDPSHPVVMFALEWCEFCWSVRKMFAAAGIPYRSIDLDSVPYQAENWGGEIRVALRGLTNTPTIPQIFVAGQHVGGCTDTFDAYKDGTLLELLKKRGVPSEGQQKLDPYSFLPSWLHPRGA